MKYAMVFTLAAACALAGSSQPARGQASDAAPRPEIKMPADYPKDVRLPKDAKPVEAGKRPTGTYRLVLQTPATLADTFAFFAKQLPAAGWTVASKKSTGAAASVIAEKGERTAALGIFDRKTFRQITIEADPGKK
jgi:hypothetical protein